MHAGRAYRGSVGSKYNFLFIVNGNTKNKKKPYKKNKQTNRNPTCSLTENQNKTKKTKRVGKYATQVMQGKTKIKRKEKRTTDQPMEKGIEEEEE